MAAGNAMFQVFFAFSDLERCIYCNGNIGMFQAYVYLFHVFRTYILNVSFECFKS